MKIWDFENDYFLKFTYNFLRLSKYWIFNIIVYIVENNSVERYVTRITSKRSLTLSVRIKLFKYYFAKTLLFLEHVCIR